MEFFIVNFGTVMINEGVYLVKDQWDDFGFKTTYQICYLNSKLEKIDLGYIKIGQKGMTFDRPELKESFRKLEDDFFSVGTEVKYYENIKKMRKVKRIEILSALNDIAYSEQAYNIAKNEEVTRRSLLRDISAMVVENQFRRIARGGSLLIPYQFSYTIKNSKSDKNQLDFNVIPDSLPPTNIHAIIGSNGTGKTTTLKGIINEYINVNNGFNTEFSNAIFISFSLFDRSDELYKKIDNGKIKFSYIGSCNETGGNKSHNEIVKEFGTSLENLIRMKKLDNFYDVLEILETDPNLEDYEISKIIYEFLDSKESNESIKHLKQSLISIFSECSSGHQITLLTSIRIIELIVEKTLIIFDEPETHLHPPLLSAFIRSISSLIINMNAVAIMATHSPVVLQEIPKNCITILRKSGLYTSVFRPKVETFGENIGILTEEVFGLEIKNTGFHTLLKKEIYKYKNYEKILEVFNNELSIEAKSIIRAYMNNI